MAKTSLPSPQVLRQLLRYDPETGRLYWRERPRKFFKRDNDANAWNARYAGQEALTTIVAGYRRGFIFKRLACAHRVAWAISYGQWPKCHIDHINGDPSDNRIINLRDVTPAENTKNAKRSRNNTSGVLGVSWDGRNQAWRVTIMVNRKAIWIGRFDCIAAASLARDEANRRFGFHENHGRR